MGDVSRRVTSPVFVGRSAELDAAGRRAGARRRRPAGVRVHRRRVGRRQDAAAARVRVPRTRARRARAARPVPRAGRRADPLRAAGRRAATARARARRRAEAETLPGGDAQRARRAAARAGRHRDARRRGARAPARAACSRRCWRCSSGSAAPARCCWRSRTCTGPTASTRDFITFLVRSAREEPLCLVVTYRSDELHRRHPLRPLLAELERAAGVDRLALERFDRDELAEQLAGILAGAGVRRAGGAALQPLAGQPALHRGAAGRERGRRPRWLLPETLRDVLIARVERLSPAAQAVVRVAAVLDRPATHGLLEAVAELAARRRSWRARARRSPTRCS